MNTIEKDDVPLSMDGPSSFSGMMVEVRMRVCQRCDKGQAEAQVSRGR